MDLEYLKGKSILEVILELPKFEWILKECGFKPRKFELAEIIFVYYDKVQPRKDVDLYHQVDVSNGLAMEDLNFIDKDRDTTFGLISKVRLGKPYDIQYQQVYAHIPMMDFDMHDNFDFMSEKEITDLIMNRVKKNAELKKGIILKSGPKKNYHFIGIGELLSPDNFITFIGLCLSMRYDTKEGKRLSLIDSRYGGHSLTPMKYMAELDEIDEQNGLSRYLFEDRFATLRVTPKPGYTDYPRVVEVFH